MSAAAITIEDLAGDPHPHLARLRAEGPVVWVDAVGGWLVTARLEAVEVLRDPETFTVDDPRFSTARVVGPSMLSTDGAEHRRHRTPWVPTFRPREVAARLESSVRAEADRLVAALKRDADAVERDADAVDVRTRLAGPLAASTMATSLGLDGGDEAVVGRLLGWYREIVASVDGIGAGREPTAAGAAAVDALGDALRGELPRSDGTLSAEELVSNAAVIMFGGIETTEGAILNALWFLLSDEDARAAVVADSDLVAAVVEESMRLEPAAAVVDRYATRDVALAGAEIGRGDLVVVSLAGANRDPAEFPGPDRFDVRRPNVRRHLTFAAGPHVCIGMDLARLEARAAVGALLRAWPDVRLHTAAPSPSGLVFRKPAALPVVLAS